MRLYTIVDNNTFLKEVLLNNSINASIKPSNFSLISTNTIFCSFLKRFSSYTNKENLNDGAILCHTAPSAFKEDSLNYSNVIISFEVDDKDVLLLNLDKYFEYVFKICDIEKNANKIDSAKKEELKEYFKNIEEKVTKIDNYFRAIGFVEEINSNSIKSAYITKNNPIKNSIITNKDKISRHVPMFYSELGLNGETRVF